MFGILPLIFALVLAQTAEGLGPAPSRTGLSPWIEVPVALILSCLAWWGLVAAAGRLLRGVRSARVLAWWDGATTAGALGLFALWTYLLHWPAMMPWSSLVQLAPYCLILIAAWWHGGLAWSGRREDARELVSVRCKFGLLPALVALCMFDAVRWLVIEPFLSDGALGSGPFAPLLGVIASFGMVAGVILVMPAVVVRLWGARPMPPGPHRELIEEGCQRMGIRVRGVLHWPAAGGRFYNAAAMGLIPHLRFVLFSDDLLRDLPPDQLRAVLGHELGHIRHRHLWIYLLFLSASVAVAWSLGPALATILAGLPLFGQLSNEALLGLAMVLLFLLLLRGIFGVVSRACERQADLAGVELAGGSEPMRQALLSVAQLSGQPLDAPSWRHHSIRERVDYLARVDDEPEEPQQQRGRVRGLTVAILVLLALGIGLAISNPLPGGGVDPEAFLAEHPRAADAITAAEDGDWSQLSAWLAQAEEDDRLALSAVLSARVQDRFAAHAEAVAAGTAQASEAEVLYGVRGLLYPLIHHPTGSATFDAMIANNAAYAAVAGTDSPSEADLDHARAALPVINAAAHQEGSAIYHDTAGCVLYRIGHRDEARKHFAYALELLPAVRMPDPDRADFERLLRRRLAACDDPAAPLPLEPAPGAGAGPVEPPP